MKIRQLAISRFRGIEELMITPGLRNVILGPNNSGKTTVLEAMDLLLHPGLGRPRPAPTEIDYFGRDPSKGFRIEGVLGDLSADFLADVPEQLEGWDAANEAVVPSPDGDGIERVVRVAAIGSADNQVSHEYAKPESAGTRFSLPLRAKLGWVFDGRARDPARQLAFYQGGVLERLFQSVDLDPAVELLRGALGQGAEAVNADEAVAPVLDALGDDLEELGLIAADDGARFEVGAVSRRELMQTLRLALRTGGVDIPLVRQGRGAQRLLLVSALLRLARTTVGSHVIAAFEEPEEALEPLRQRQVAMMISGIADAGGQVFVVTHSPDIARSFGLDDFLLMEDPRNGRGVKALAKTVGSPTRQAYERRVDGPALRALFARIPLLVEGPGDRGVIGAFWEALAAGDDEIPSYAALGVDLINSEGAPNMPQLAALLDDAGKTVVAFAEADRPDVLARLQSDARCKGLILYPDSVPNLEELLVRSCSVPTLVAALTAVAEDRGYTWEQQHGDLLSRCDGFSDEARQAVKDGSSLEECLLTLGDAEARTLALRALSAKSVSPFEMKGARQGRLVAEGIVDATGVPRSFAGAIKALVTWINEGCRATTEIRIEHDPPPT